MKRRLVLLVLVVFVAGAMVGQDVTPTPTPARKRGWMSRMLHPFSPNVVPQYKDPRLRGLSVDLQITPQTVKLSEVRQLSVKVTLANLSKKPATLDFPTTQRIEIYLTNSAGEVLTKWSENHAIADKPGTILINPSERIEYNETISTRELAPNKVFIAEVFFPQFLELRVRQKFLAVP
jgi:Intracellular proteinase inhibitor